MSPAVQALLEIAPAALEFIGGVIMRWLDGDDSPEVVRLIELLPETTRADLEHERQRRKLEADLEAR